MRWVDDWRNHGDWQEPWYPSNIAELPNGKSATFRQESTGAGVQGAAKFRIENRPTFDVPMTEFLTLEWQRAYIETSPPGFEKHAHIVLGDAPSNVAAHPPPALTAVIDHGFGEIANSTDSDGELAKQLDASVGPTVPVVGGATVPIVMLNEAYPKQISWTVEVVDLGLTDRTRSFGTKVFTAGETAMAAFRSRTDMAASHGFAAGYPTFVDTRRLQGHFAGTVFFQSAGVEWRDVPLTELGSPPLEDFIARMRATNAYARAQGFLGGFPTFYHADYGHGVVCGTVLLKANCGQIVYRPSSVFRNPKPDDIEAIFRSVHEYVSSLRYSGDDLPVYGTLTLNDRLSARPAGNFTAALAGDSVAENLVEAGIRDLVAPKGDAATAAEDLMRSGMRDLILAKFYVGGFPTFETSQGMEGIILIKPDVAEWQDLLLYKDPS